MNKSKTLLNDLRHIEEVIYSYPFYGNTVKDEVLFITKQCYVDKMYMINGPIIEDDRWYSLIETPFFDHKCVYDEKNEDELLLTKLWLNKDFWEFERDRYPPKTNINTEQYYYHQIFNQRNTLRKRWFLYDFNIDRVFKGDVLKGCIESEKTGDNLYSLEEIIENHNLNLDAQKVRLYIKSWKKPHIPNVDNVPIEVLNQSIGCLRSLDPPKRNSIFKDNHIIYIGDLLRLKPNDIIKFKWIGLHTVKIIEDELRKYGYKLGIPLINWERLEEREEDE